MWDFYRTENTFHLYRQVRIPVRVIIGDQDEFLHFPEFGVTTESALAKMKMYLPDCETTTLPNCGHIFIGSEQKVAEEVVRFTSQPRR